MKADGSSVRRLTYSGGYAPAWSPDGRQILFVRGLDGEDVLCVMNADGSNVAVLAEGMRDPSWSPDGKRIACHSRSNNIHVMDADGSGLKRLTDDFVSTHARWSPDSTKLAFQSRRTGYYQGCLMNANGSSQTRISDYPAHETHFSWSPDGTRILFNSSRGRGDDEDLYLMEYHEDAEGNPIVSQPHVILDDDTSDNDDTSDIYATWGARR